MTTQSHSNPWIHRSPFRASSHPLAGVLETLQTRRERNADFAREISSYPATRGVAPLTRR
ncbi:MAG: hypothetical protein WA892_07365 [Ornithinimicrobium sp.]